MGKKPTVSVIYENERISIKNSLPYIKCVLRLSWVYFDNAFMFQNLSPTLENLTFKVPQVSCF